MEQWITPAFVVAVGLALWRENRAIRQEIRDLRRDLRQEIRDLGDRLDQRIDRLGERFDRHLEGHP